MLLAIVLVAALIRPGPIDVGSLIVRYANFLGGLFLLATYLRSGLFRLSTDLLAIMPWMAVQAILTSLLAAFAPSLFQIVAMPDDGSMFSIFYVFNYHVLIEDFAGLHRPNGFFWEPGVFQLYLNLYLFLALFVFHARKHIWLALVALVCVYSTTGVVITGLLLLTALAQRLSKGRMRQRVVVLVAATLIAPAMGFIAYKNVEEKLTGETQGSATIRQYDLLVGMSIVAQHPILGIGFDHDRYMDIAPSITSAQEQLGLTETPERSTSNGVAYLAYTLGLPLALAFLWGIFRQKTFPYPWLLGLVVFMAMLGEALIFTPFILMIIFSAFVKLRAPMSRRQEQNPMAVST